MEVLIIIKEIVVTVAAATAAVVAVKGLSTWRLQLAGQHEYDIARSLLRAAYRVRNAISWVRNPFMTSGEIATALKQREDRVSREDAYATPAGTARATAAAYELRWKSVTEALSDLDLARLEAEVLWGVETAHLSHDLRKCVGRLNGALHTYFSEELNDKSRSTISTEEYRKVREIVFFQGGYTDAFNDDVQCAIEPIESYVRPRMASK